MALPPVFPSGVATAFLYPRQTTSTGTGIGSQTQADPGNTNPPIIFEPPSALSGGDLEVWIIATGMNANWGGCQVWASVDNTGYARIGTILLGGIQGLLTATFPYHADPDSTNALKVDLTLSNGTLVAGTTTDADDFVTLCYCDGELIAYSAATLTSSFHYTLDTYIRRGCYGSTIGGHLAGKQFGRILGSTFVQKYPSNLIGKTLYFKFPAFNTYGASLQDLSTCVAYQFTLTGSSAANTLNWYQSFSVGSTFRDMVLDPWDSNYEVFDVEAPQPLSFPANFAGSPTPGCEVAPAGDVTLTFQRIHGTTRLTEGTMTIAASATTGSYSSGAFTLPTGDRLRCYAPFAVDTTMAGVFGTIVGKQGGSGARFPILELESVGFGTAPVIIADTETSANAIVNILATYSDGSTFTNAGGNQINWDGASAAAVGGFLDPTYYNSGPFVTLWSVDTISAVPNQSAATTYNLNLVATSGTAGDASSTTPITIELIPAISFSPASLSFGSQTVGTSSASQSIIATNVGNVTMPITISLAGTNPGDYSQTNTSGGSLAPSASCTIHVTFTPTATGSRPATVKITDTGNGYIYQAALSGTGI